MGTIHTMQQLGRMGVWPRSRDVLSNFGIPSIFLHWIATHFKFGVWVDHQAHKPKNTKVSQKGRGLGQVTYFYNFYTPHAVYGTAEVTNLKVGA